VAPAARERSAVERDIVAVLMSSDRARLRVVVRGWVQGVGYRDFASHEAVRLGLKGYVRNSSDASVEIEAEGERADLQRFLDILRQGPRFAEVRDVEAVWDSYQGEFKDWDLRW
jgi:acylphosphatase